MLVLNKVLLFLSFENRDLSEFLRFMLGVVCGGVVSMVVEVFLGLTKGDRALVLQLLVLLAD